MALTKLINGVRVQMSEEDEAKIRSTWATESVEQQQREAEKLAKSERKDQVLGKLKLTAQELKDLLDA